MVTCHASGQSLPTGVDAALLIRILGVVKSLLETVVLVVAEQTSTQQVELEQVVRETTVETF
jgi:hypothetical protein